MASKGVPEARLRTFVEVFVAKANATEAAREAGYRGSAKVVSESARKLLRRADVQAMIEALQDKLTEKREDEGRSRIATRQERQEFWTTIMRGEHIEQMHPVTGQPIEAPAPLGAQMKASELLAKSEGDFIKRVEVKHGGQVMIVKAKIPDNGRSRVTPPDAEQVYTLTGPDDA